METTRLGEFALMTLNWPFYDLDLLLLTLMFVGGLVAAIFAIRMWKSIIKQRRLPPDTLFHTSPQQKESYSSFQAGCVTLAAFVFTLAGGLSTVLITVGKYQFRKLPTETIEAIEVFQADDESNVNRSKIVRIENTDGKIVFGLQLLKKCGSQSRNHEHFENGYVIRLVFDDQKLNDFYISAFRRSSSGKEKSIVLAQRESVRNLNLGEYECPEFQEWLKDTIDPLFNAINPTSSP